MYVNHLGALARNIKIVHPEDHRGSAVWPLSLTSAEHAFPELLICAVRISNQQSSSAITVSPTPSNSRTGPESDRRPCPPPQQ